MTHPALHHNSNAKWVTAYVGLGANLGDARQALLEAARQLADADGIEDLALSPLYRSAPVGSSGPDYINAVARLRTRLAPHPLLDALQHIEQLHGRERPYRNAPRTLDLDLLWFEGVTQDDPVLTLPHPRMHERAFVLRPLRDLAPALPLAQGDLDTLVARTAHQVLRRLPDEDSGAD